jgi:hypothetical protein
VLEPGGGLDVLLALEKGARSVVAVEDDAALAGLKGSRLARQSRRRLRRSARACRPVEPGRLSRTRGGCGDDEAFLTPPDKVL